LSALLVIHAAATLAMTGVIWFVQIVQYPLMARVGREAFVRFHAMHVRRTGLVVGPLMLVEAASAVGIALLRFEGPGRIGAWAGVGLLAAVWLSTALVQVPLHRRLAEGHDPVRIARLVHGNWLRTVCWSLRAGLALAWVAPAG